MEIKVKRTAVTPQFRVSVYWVYSYKTPADETLKRGDGSEFFRPAGTWVEWGTGKDDFKSFLRRKFGRDIKIVETWK